MFCYQGCYTSKLVPDHKLYICRISFVIFNRKTNAWALHCNKWAMFGLAWNDICGYFSTRCSLDGRAQCVGSIWRCHLTSIGNPIGEIRWSYDRLISTMGFPILIRWHLYIEFGPLWINPSDLSSSIGCHLHSSKNLNNSPRGAIALVSVFSLGK